MTTRINEESLAKALQDAVDEPGGFQRAMAESNLEQALHPDCDPALRPVLVSAGIGWAILAIAEKLAPSPPVQLEQVEETPEPRRPRYLGDDEPAA